MDQSYDRIAAAAASSQDQAARMLERLMDVAQPESVYSEPVVSGSYTLITACEVTAGVGFGFGIGAGSGNVPASEQTEEKAEAGGQGTGAGGGGGGGGGSMARPVAVITISPEGVNVEPVVDVTKLGLAMFVTAGSMLMMLARMARLSRG